MRFQRLIQAAAAGLLFSLAANAFGQMETREGKRHAGPGAVTQSASTFAVGLTRDNGLTFVSSAAISDTVEIRGLIRPEPENTKQLADIFVVDRWLDDNGGHLGYRMRNQDGVWQTWNGSVAELVPFRENVLLGATHELSVFSGVLEIAGAHRIFLGYMAGDGILRYHMNGLPITISEVSTQTPREQARALFESTINPHVIPYCLDCHVSGGAAQGQSQHIFVRGSSDIAIDTNFDQLHALFSSHGEGYILAKARGDDAHLGGPVLPPSSQQYRDLQRFLELLGQL